MDLARVYTKRRDFSEAEKLFNLVFESRKLYLGSENPLTLNAVSSIAWLRTWQSRWNDAADLYKTVLVARGKAHGHQHPDTVDSMEDLASVYAKLSNFSAADDLYKQALTLRTEVFGESDPKTLNTISRIASLRYQQNRFTDMEQLLQIVLQGYKALPSCTPEVLAITVELAELSRDQCKLHKAEREGEEAVRFGTTQLGSDHPDVKAAKLSLAGTKEFLGKLSEAATLYNEVLDSESKLCGPEKSTKPEYRILPRKYSAASKTV
jgi:tetratricopeptide (TPR) repeat protein